MGRVKEAEKFLNEILELETKGYQIIIWKSMHDLNLKKSKVGQAGVEGIYKKIKSNEKIAIDVKIMDIYLRDGNNKNESNKNESDEIINIYGPEKMRFAVVKEIELSKFNKKYRLTIKSFGIGEKKYFIYPEALVELKVVLLKPKFDGRYTMDELFNYFKKGGSTFPGYVFKIG